jgi:dTDP-4-dehydrorhamnose 3,5-epimerase
MNVIETSLNGVLMIDLEAYEDQRGFFMEYYHWNRYHQLGISKRFVQDNLSFSVQNTLRGLHYQLKSPQAKLVQAVTGEIYDVAVDIRVGSATYGKWTGVHLSGENKRQMYIPEGFAHGFCVLSQSAQVLYKCSDFYSPEDEGGISWADPELAIDWPVQHPIISEKDRNFPRLSELSLEKLPSLEK